MIQVTVDKVGLDQDSDQAVILLCDLSRTTFIPIWIRALEAASIAMPLQGIKTPRPLTADLCIEVAEELGATFLMAVVTEIRDDTFYARLILSQGEREIEIDCRPSDAIAIALRKGVPIYVAEKVIAQAGVSMEENPVQ